LKEKQSVYQAYFRHEVFALSMSGLTKNKIILEKKICWW